MIVECKNLAVDLSADLKVSQLIRYFAAKPATPIGILTNGLRWKFYSDLVTPNVMDSIPFFEFYLLDMTASQIGELEHFTHDQFRTDEIKKRANRMQWIDKTTNVLRQEFAEPTVNFYKYFSSNGIEAMPKVAGQNTNANIRSKYLPWLKDAFSQFKDEIKLEALKEANIRQSEPERIHSQKPS